MNRRALLSLLALSALLLGGLGWALTREEPRPPGAVTEREADPKPVARTGTDRPVDGRETATAPAEAATAKADAHTKDPQAEIIRPEAPGKGGEGPAGQGSPAAGDPGAPQGSAPARRNQSDAAAGEGRKPQAESAPPTPTLPTPARVPTPRERAEQARYAGGANLPSTAAIPKVTSNGEPDRPPLDMTRLADKDVWNEYWAREGY